MSVETNAGFDAAAQAPAYGVLALVEARARSGVIRLTDWPLDVVAMGQTWKGIGSLGKVGELHESDDGAAQKLDFTLSPVDLSMKAFALSDANDWQDRPIRLWVVLVDAQTHQMVGSPVLRFAGVMDNMKLDRPEANDGSEEPGIRLAARTATYNVRNNPAALRMNNAQHRARFPAERGFEYLQGLIGNPSVYASLAFSAFLYIRNMLGVK
ncbi:hypothetical protein [Pseudacidovorax intermedius]|uniref:Uncharacterized protein n=1 Tax=Pseudacidovorax intermedius TaxID=433924 RepID=A0A147GWD9_9BURK|nr:hypothetical protein [Pseudacidovorax intermedius]KTT21904.1 hypothetical protein NS331_11125 [Pseudacidovorax intermedius]